MIRDQRVEFGFFSRTGTEKESEARLYIQRIALPQENAHFCSCPLRSGIGLQHLECGTQPVWLGRRLQSVLRRQPSRWYRPSLRLGRLAEDRGQKWPRSADWPSASGALWTQDSWQFPVRGGAIHLAGRQYRRPSGFRRRLARHPATAHDGGAGMVDSHNPGSSLRSGCPLLVDVLRHRSSVDREKEALDRGRRVLALYLQVSPRIGYSRHVGGSETLENAHRRGNSCFGIDRILLSNRRAQMAAPILEDVANAGILAHARGDAKYLRPGLQASMDDID